MQTIYVFFGLIASGKSTLAQAFAQKHGLPYYNTDRVRKELAGLAMTDRRPDGLHQGIYSAEFTRKTYQALLERMAADLQKGAIGVVLDGSYTSRGERERVIAAAAQYQADVLFILCSCSDQEVKRRLALRAMDPRAVSDGRWEIYVAQKEKFIDPEELPVSQLIRMNTEETVPELLSMLEKQFGS